ncbi:TetR/AcrR family transcriptional regulator [Streptomyces celluloflavus]|uniref:TetR/AcrR family transcriptional regulator n=1 Tax=Streptomyces celluloflavus TaxID=58344 RepID=UPI0037B1547A
MHIQGSQWPTAIAHPSDSGGNGNSGNGGSADNGGLGAAGHGAGAGSRNAPLRVDAQRNLEHVLRAAREVFGELGYGAPMEDVARRARVGVGTVYRRFPSKDVLVRRIAEEETSRLTDQARTALGQEEDPWSALSRFLRTSVASGAGRLLPPGILRVSEHPERVPDGLAEARVPQQRMAPGPDGQTDPRVATGTAGVAAGTAAAGDPEGLSESAEETKGAQALLDVVGRLVERARSAGELRADVTVADVLLVIATGAPTLPDPGHQQAASARLLEILLEGLRSRPAG